MRSRRLLRNRRRDQTNGLRGRVVVADLMVERRDLLGLADVWLAGSAAMHW